MLKIEGLYKWLFIIGFALLIPSLGIFRYADELVVYSILLVAIADCVANRAWRRYTFLLVFLGVMTAYLVYSLTAVHYNTAASVCYGWVLEMKPYIPIAVFSSAPPRFGPRDRKLIRGIAIFNLAVLALILPIFDLARAFIFGHDAFYGGAALVTALVYLYFSIDPEKGFTRRGLLVFWMLMILGLLSGRSKYYAEFVTALALIVAYRQQFTRHLSLRHVIGMSLLGVAILAVVWDKLNTYFLQGIDLSSLDLERMNELARLALYAMSPMVLMLHPVFGTGFASYCSLASAEPGYSAVYGEFSMDKVYGLSPDYHDFICDAYYPSLVQFGTVGIVLFVWFWVKTYSYLRPFTRDIGTRRRAEFIIGIIILISIFIEMTTGTMVFQGPGEMMAMLLGIICGHGRRLTAAREDASPATETGVQPKRI